MSSFKELKKKSNIKVWENKIKRLYASDLLTESDLRYLNIQFDYYTQRKTFTSVISLMVSGLTYSTWYIKDMHIFKRGGLSICIGYLFYLNLRKRNRIHYEKIINPYFEKYYVK